MSRERGGQTLGIPAIESATKFIRVHGHDRGVELQDAIQQGTGVVAESEAPITAYASSIAFFGHAVGESNLALHALIAAATEFQGREFLS